MDPNKEDNKEVVVQAASAGPVQRAGYVEAHVRPSGHTHEDLDEMPGGGLLEYWRIIQRRKGWIILAAFLGVLAAVLYTLPQTPVYQARVSLEIQSLNENFLNMKDVNPVQGGASWDTVTDIQTQIRLLQSAKVLERTMAKLKVGKPEDLKQQASRVQAWRKALNLPEPTPEDAHEQALAAAAGSVKARASGQTRLVEVLVDSTDPKVAADFANTLANEFIDQNIEARWEMTQRTGEWLSRQLEEMKIKLEKSEDSLQEYARASGLMFMTSGDEKGSGSNVSQEKLRQVQAELSKAQAERTQKQSRFEMAKSSPPEALPDVLNDSSLREYQSKLTELRRQEAELSTTYKSDFSKVKRVHAQIATVEAALERERGAIVKRIQNEYDEAMRREKLLSTDYASQAKTVTSDAEKSIQYNILKREVDSNRQLYEAMLQRVKESSIASAMKASNVRVVDEAKAPKSPYKPRLPMNAGLGLLAGSFLGVAFVVMRERADRSIQQPGDTPFYLNVPELGVVPSAEAGHKRLYYLKRKQLAAEPKSSVLSVTTVKAQPQRVELATYVNKSSAVAESFRATLTSILFSGHNGSRPRMLVVTSASPGEGKTTVASNLAVAITEIGQRVLLVDADLRKPRLHEIFGVENTVGLGDLLRDRTLEMDLVQAAIQEPTAVPGLSVLPSGAPTAAASNLLHSPVLPELLKRLKGRFDMVLIDTPPMLQMPDARVAGRIADAVVLVVRAEKTTRDEALAARQRFAEDSTRVLGTVLNDWNPKRTGAGYGGYRAYGGHAYKAYEAKYATDEAGRSGNHEKPA